MIGSSVRVVGGLLPTDILDAVVAGTADGLKSDAFHLGGEPPKAAAARVWPHLVGAYQQLRRDLDALPDGDPAIGVTRERWLTVLLSDLGYGRVPATPAGGLVVDGKPFPVSHIWGATPIHLLGWGTDLDKRTPGVAGAAQRAPHALMQELLNRTDDYLWALLSNGRTLRLLRDSTTLTGQAYVEFDLETMFDAELFSDFVTLFLLCHESRVEVPDGQRPEDCWLEQWRVTAVGQGVRALDLLREGVQIAIETLGTGFLQHPANQNLRDRIANGDARVDDLHQSLLRTVYRLLFWAVIEDRGVLHDPVTALETKDRYQQYFSSRRLRQLAVQRYGSAHDDLWQAVTFVLDALAQTDGESRLGLPGLGGVFSHREDDVLIECRLGNQPLLAAIRALSVVHPKGQPRRHVDFRQLGAEELGGIYESLLELVPRHDPLSHRFSLELLAGNDRKTTGSYYTPTELVDLVLDTALDPVLDDAEKQEGREAALLAITICDPAIGSGHFMVAAARRIAQRLAVIRSEEIDPTPASVSEAMHDVVANCIYGVDLNPMAADLAKVSLWLEAMTPGKPMSFLDHHIKVGNALLGTTPALLHAGIPDAAYVALTGDDKQVVSSWKKRNAAERAGQGDLFDEGGLPLSNASLRTVVDEISDHASAARSLAEIAWAQQRYDASRTSTDSVRARQLADAWCAAFLVPKTAELEPITHGSLRQFATGKADAATLVEVAETAARHRLFHWHLEFPQIFRVAADEPANTPSGWTGGFSAMLGNPPWERIKLQEQEFFASREPAIAEARNAAARKKAIAGLGDTNPALLAEFDVAKRRSEAESSFLRGSARYPLCGVGDVNTYSVFAEHFRAALGPKGRSGIITPTGLATDATTAAFFADTVASERLVAFYDFENEAKIFSNVHNQFRFAVSSMTGGERVQEVRLAFYTRYVADVMDRRFAVSAGEIQQLNPNTGTLPVFRTRRDAEVTLSCYKQHPILIRDGESNPWGLRFARLFDMANDSEEFCTADDLRGVGADFDGWKWDGGDESWLPLYEAKMLYHWNSRYATYDGATEAQLNKGTLPRLTEAQLDDPLAEPLARYWVDARSVDQSMPPGWDRSWLLGWRDITNASNERTFVPSVLPKVAVGHKFPVATIADPRHGALLQATWSSLAFDYISRQKLSGSGMTYFIVKQLACPPPSAFDARSPWSSEPLGAWVRQRVLELAYTSCRIQPYAIDILERNTDVVEPDPGQPFRWIPDRRVQIRAEIEAAMLHLYGLDRSDTEHVLDSFFVVRKYEERDHGEFRTKRLVLAAFDAMSQAAETGVPFVSPLDPPPGAGPRHLPRTQ